MSTDSEILRLGDPWNEHYRGTRYHFNTKRKLWWQVPATEARVEAASGHEGIVTELLTLRPEGGSCRITETGAVITKSQEDTDDWAPLYVCEYVDPLQFEHVETHGSGLQPFDLWRAFYDGARYSFKRGRLWWRNPLEGVWQRTNESLPPEIEKRFNQVKPFGGTLRFTENGKVLTLIVPQPMPRHLRPQYEALSNTQKHLIQVKIEGTDMLPVYIGDYLGGFTLLPPERLTDPLSDEEQAKMLDFLKQYGANVHGQEDDPLLFRDDRLEEVV